MDEGLALYNEEENKKQIDAAIAAAGGKFIVSGQLILWAAFAATFAGDQAKLMATATPLALTIGKPLLEKYGFTADPMGMCFFRSVVSCGPGCIYCVAGFMMLITSLTMATAADPVLKAQLADLQAKVMPRAA